MFPPQHCMARGCQPVLSYYRPLAIIVFYRAATRCCRGCLGAASAGTGLHTNKRTRPSEPEPVSAAKKKTIEAMTAGTRRSKASTSKPVNKMDAEYDLAESDSMHWERHGGQVASEHCCRCNFIRHKTELLIEFPWLPPTPSGSDGR